jgi:trehalose transport system permease protein
MADPTPRSAGVTAWVRAHRLDIALAAPLFLYVLVLTIAPILDTIRLSLTAPPDGAFPSVANYRALLASDVFWAALRNTVVVAFLSITLQLGLGLAVALTLHAHFRFRALVRTVILLPLGVPTVVAGAVMLLIFSRSGYLNALLFLLADAVEALFGIHWHVALSWGVAGGWRTLATVAIADMWKVLPMVTLILLAGLQAIPGEVNEAADVDGVTHWQRFSRITLPLLVPYLTMAIVLRAIDAFRIFELALVLAGRVEPVLGTYIWSRYGPPTNDPFTAAAASIVLFALILVFVLAYMRTAAGVREGTP